MVELAAGAVVQGDTQGAWRRQALPQAVQGQLEQHALCVDPRGPLEVLHRLRGHRRYVVCATTYRSDAGEARLVTGGWDKMVRRWTLSGAEIDALSGHDKWVTSMMMSLDRYVFLGTGDDGGTRVCGVTLTGRVFA